MIGFLLFYFGIYGSMHAYLFWKARRAFEFGWKPGVALALLMLVQMLAPILLHAAERAGWLGAARVLAWVGYTWFAFVFLFFSYGLCLDFVRLLAGAVRMALGRDIGVAITHRWAFLIPVAIALFSMIYGLWEASAPRTVRVRLKSPAVPPGVTLRVAMISDLHLGLLVREPYLRKVAAILEREKPDLLVSTGDLVDGEMNHLDGASRLLDSIRPPLGKFAVVGNHEFYAGLPQALGFTTRAGFRVLRGEAVDVGEWLTVAGVDDIQGRRFGSAAGPSAEELLSSLPPGRFVLFLNHRPLVAEETAEKIGLQLSGHTHGGQIFPFDLAVALAHPHPMGLVDLPAGGRLYTSRGTGTWGPPMRVFSPPEVTLFEISN